MEGMEKGMAHTTEGRGGEMLGGRWEVADGGTPVQPSEELEIQRPLSTSESLGLKNTTSNRKSAENNELKIGIASSRE